LNLQQFSFIETFLSTSAAMAADVHFSAVDNSGEFRGVEKSAHRRRLAGPSEADAGATGS
jgi:hypothetical protein